VRDKILFSSCILAAPALWNSLPPDLTSFCFSLYFLSTYNSHLFSRSPYVFQKAQKSSFSLFFSSLVSRPRLPLDAYLRNWPGFVVSSHCHCAIIHLHVTIIILYYLYWHCLIKVVINLFNFYRHFKLTPFHTVIRVHLFNTISYFCSSSYCFLWSMLAIIVIKCHALNPWQKEIHFL
jgi:hypothetical protein